MDIWSILILLSIGQGVFTLSLILMRRKQDVKGSINLFFLVLILLWFQLEFLAIRNVFDVQFPLFYGTRFGSWFLMGPVIYFYFSEICNPEFNFDFKKLIHFLPFIIFAVLIPLINIDELSYRQIHYGMLTVFDKRPEVITPYQYVYGTVFIAQFIHLAGYLRLNNYQLKAYQKNLKSTYSSIDEDQLRWLGILNNGMLLILTVSILFLALLLFSPWYRRYMDYIYVLPMAILSYLVGFNLAGVSWKKSEQEVSKPYEKSGLATEELKLLADRMIAHIHDQRIYLNNTLRLKDLASALEITTHQATQVITQQLDTTFYDLINSYRISEAKKVIQEKPELTLIQIGFEAGFNNKTSFVNAFKKFEETTPSAFWKKVNKAS